MTYHATRQRKADERAFPVRLNFKVPGMGMGQRLNDLHEWLARTEGRENFAIWPGPRMGSSDVIGVHLRTCAVAAALAAEFSDLELADGTMVDGYTSPALPSGRK